MSGNGVSACWASLGLRRVNLHSKPRRLDSLSGVQHSHDFYTRYSNQKRYMGHATLNTPYPSRSFGLPEVLYNDHRRDDFWHEQLVRDGQHSGISSLWEHTYVYECIKVRLRAIERHKCLRYQWPSACRFSQTERMHYEKTSYAILRALFE